MTSTKARQSARAVLIDGNGRLVTIKRTKPGMAPYWTTPGGGVEPEDAGLEAALERELLEELGATAAIGRELPSVTSSDGESVQHFFAARLLSMDESLRTGDEHTNATRGNYDIDRIRLDELAACDLKPTLIRDWILDNRAALLGALPPATAQS